MKHYKTQITVDGNSVRTREYLVWIGMKTRVLQKKAKAYLDCSISNNFMDFQFFADWCNNQIGWNEDGWHLDKDFLVEGNKVYGEDYCLFVPRVVNTIFADTSPNSCGLTGAIWISHSNKYQARCSEFGKQIAHGLYLTAEEAHSVWAKKKVEYVHKVAEMYKGRVRDEVYEKLANFYAE